MIRKRLIINADGFGFTYGNNRAIFEVLEAGIVRSISVNANFPAVEQVPRVVKEFREVSIGIHLNLSVGRPVCKPDEVSSLLNDSGEFWGNGFPKKALTGKLKISEIQKELKAQFETLKKLGVKISHWDSHQDRHLYLPFFRCALEAARLNGVGRMRNHRRWLFANEDKARLKAWRFYLTHPRRFSAWLHHKTLMVYARKCGMKMADHFLCPGAYGRGREILATWKKIFHFLPYGNSEITCHPGYPDETLKKYATMIDNRPKEAAVLKDKSLLDVAMENGVEIINFRQL